MSGIDYANPKIQKSDLHSLEKYTNAQIAAISGGGGGGRANCVTVFGPTTAFPLNAGADTLITFSGSTASVDSFAVSTDTITWIAARTGVFVATFCARCINNSIGGADIDFGVQVMTGASGSPTALLNGTGYALASKLMTPESTNRVNMVFTTPRFSLNSGQVIQLRAITNATADGLAQFDATSITSGGRTINAPGYTFFVQEVA